MRLIRTAGALLVAALLVPAASALAQAPVAQPDIQRLQDSVYQASRDIDQLRARDPRLASQLQSELDDARDEVIYLKVKLRKHEPVSENEYLGLREHIDDIRERARGGTGPGAAPAAQPAPAPPPPGGRWDPNARVLGQNPPAQQGSTAPAANPDEIPVGTEFDVRLEQPLSSATAQVEDRFEATTMVDLRNGDRVLVPAGSVMRGVVRSVTRATRTERKGALQVSFDRITIDHRSYPLRATVEQALESAGIRGEAGKIGAGAGIGAIIGGILGGAKGALAGILIGGGGTIAATEGKDVELPIGTVLRVRMDSALTVQ